jgi:hypothetical protein
VVSSASAEAGKSSNAAAPTNETDHGTPDPGNGTGATNKGKNSEGPCGLPVKCVIL